MNEWERRVLEVSQNHDDLMEAAGAMSADALVEYFGYLGQIGTIAAPLVSGIPQQTVVAIQADSSFVLQYVSSCVLYSNATVGNGVIFNPSGNILLQITDTGAGEVLYSGPSLAGILGGTVAGGFCGIPMLLPIPRVIPPNSNVKIEVTQVGVSAANLAPVTVYVALLGARVANLRN